MNTPQDTINEPYKIRITQRAVLPRNEPIYSEQCTTITIIDESSGEYLEVEQQSGQKQKICINPEEWPQLKKAIEWMFFEIRDNEPNQLS